MMILVKESHMVNVDLYNFFRLEATITRSMLRAQKQNFLIVQERLLNLHHRVQHALFVASTYILTTPLPSPQAHPACFVAISCGALAYRLRAFSICALSCSFFIKRETSSNLACSRLLAALSLSNSCRCCWRALRAVVRSNTCARALPSPS